MQPEVGCLPSPPCHQAISCLGENQGDAEVEGLHLQLVSVAVGLAAQARQIHPAKTPAALLGSVEWCPVGSEYAAVLRACNCKMNGSVGARQERSKLHLSIQYCATANVGRGHQARFKEVECVMEGGVAHTVYTRTLFSCNPFAH